MSPTLILIYYHMNHYSYLHCFPVTTISIVRNLFPPSTIHCLIAIYMHSDFTIVNSLPCGKRLTDQSIVLNAVLVWSQSYRLHSFPNLPFLPMPSMRLTHRVITGYIPSQDPPIFKRFEIFICIKAPSLCGKILWVLIRVCHVTTISPP